MLYADQVDAFALMVLLVMCISLDGILEVRFKN